MGLACSALHALSVLVVALPPSAGALAELGVVPQLVRCLATAATAQSAPAKHATAGWSAAGRMQSTTVAARAVAAAPEALLGQRAAGLLRVLCRGGGPAVDAALRVGGGEALARRLLDGRVSVDERCDAAAALAPLLKKSGELREVLGASVLPALLALLRARGEAADPDVSAAFAALVAQGGPACRADGARALRQLLLSSEPREAAGAAAVVLRLASGAAGREVIAGEELLPPLVRLLGSGASAARAW